ncbi:MAG TPA: alpha/beta hydrolase [Caulifigura sp.]|nr:alpha/beta hydrolase [Caulifigura sp.]
MLYVVIPYVAVTVIFTVLQRRLIYRPTVSARGLLAGTQFAPHSADDITILSHDRLELNGWRIQSATRPAESPASLVIYFPGNAANRGARREDVVEFARLGFDVLIVDYRGYGENKGSPTEDDLTRDARAVWDAALGNWGYRPEAIVLFGESLGGAVAIRLAADLSAADSFPAAVVVASTFTSLPDVAAWAYPAFPFRHLLFDRFDSLSQIGKVRSAIAIIHGDSDDLVPVEQGRRLFASAREASASGRPKLLDVRPGMGHNDIPAGVVSRILIGLLPADRQGEAIETGRFSGESGSTLPMK